METLRLILLFVHLLAIAALIGGLVVQLGESEKVVNGAMRDGAGTAFLAGLFLVGVTESLGDVDHVKIAVKLLIGLIVLALVMANLRKPRIPDGLYYGLLALSVINVGVAVFWSTVHA